MQAFETCLVDLRESFAKFAEQTGDTPDKIAKGSEFVTFLLGRVFPPPPQRPAGAAQPKKTSASA